MTANCPSGQRVVSGGYDSDSGYAFIDKTYSGTGWTVGIDNFDRSTTADVEVTALCAPAGQAIAVSASERNADIERDVAARRAAH